MPEGGELLNVRMRRRRLLHRGAQQTVSAEQHYSHRTTPPVGLRVILWVVQHYLSRNWL